MSCRVGVWLVGFVGLAVRSAAAAEPSAVDFAQQIRPLLAARCFSCHGPDKREAGLRLHRRADALAGGDRGAAIVPGKGAESRLVRFLTGENDEKIVMPPAGKGDRLTAEEVALVRRWIDEGAKWDEAAKAGEPLRQSAQPAPPFVR